MRPKIFISRPVHQAAIDRVAQSCDVQVHTSDAPIPPEMFGEMIRDADAVMPCGQKVSASAIAEAPKLRAIANIGAGYENIDLAACKDRRIIVTNTPDVVTEATADLAFSLLLAAARRVVEGDRYVREGRWPYWQWNFLWGAETHGKTLGLYGFGRIAQAMARRGRGFGLRVLYYARHRAPANLESELSAQLVDRETLLRECDFLSVHVPASLETHHCIGHPELALMKPSAFIINTARGNIIDEAALVEALRDHGIAGAGLDVFEHEPHVHPELLAMENVVLMPHAGTATAETRRRMAMLAAENLVAVFEGRRPANFVNPEIWDEN